MVKYQIANREGHGRSLVATGRIGKGEKILCEKPLASIDVGLADTHDSNRFFNATKQYNGVQHLQIVVDRLSPTNKKLLESLHNSKGEGVEGTFSTNAFGDDETKDGQNHLTLRIYNKISRANHSCRPNAYCSFDLKTGYGSLHALREIPNREEITIEYLASESNSLRSWRSRQKDFTEHWGFDCDCQVCGGNQGARNADSGQRTQAGQLKIRIDPEQIAPTEMSEQGRQQRLGRVNQYLDMLRGLGISDIKLSSAYQALAKVHKEGYDTAIRVGVAGHCVDCTADRTPRGHLDKALNALREMVTIDICCLGAEHTSCKETDKTVSEYNTLRAKT